MEHIELIARQAKEIEELKDKVSEYEASNKAIYDLIYCIGGPLNDNVKRYTREQMKDFFTIAQLINID